MKTAQELFDTIQKNKAQSVENQYNRVTEKVELFIEEWEKLNGTVRVLTREQMEEHFENIPVVCEILRKQGFQIRVTPESETGHLWWKKKIPEKWEIRIPVQQVSDK